MRIVYVKVWEKARTDVQKKKDGAPLGFFVTSDKEPKRRKEPMVP